MLQGQTFRSKLALWLSIISLVPLITVGYFTYSYTVKIVKEREINNIDEITETKATEITNYVEDKINEVHGLANFIELQKTSSNDSSLTKNNTVLNKFKKIYDFNDIILISSKGKILYSVANQNDAGLYLDESKYKNSELSKTFETVAAQKLLKISEIQYYSFQKEYAEYIVDPIFIKNKFAGVIVVELNTKKLLSIIGDSTGLGKTGETVIARKQGNKALFIAPLRNKRNAAFNYAVKIGSKSGVPIQLAVTGKKGMGLSVDYAGKKIIASWRYIPILNLGLVVKINQDEAFAPAITLKRWIIIVVFLIAFLAIAVAFVLSGNISKPIEDLTKASRAIAEGNFANTINIKSTGEIKLLAETFSYMQKNLHEAILKRDKEIAERKSAEKLLLESKIKFKSLFEQSADAIFLLKNNKIIDCNIKAAELFKCSRDEILNSTPVKFSPVMQPGGESSQKLAEQYIKASLNLQPQFFEWQHKKFDGTLFFAEINLKAIELPEGKIICAQVSDITKRKTAEAEIQKLSLAVKQAAVSILITDIEGNIEYVNKKYEGVSGYSLEELYMRKPSILKSGLTDEKTYKYLWETISSGNPWKGEFLNRKKSGKLFWESCNIAPMTDENGKIIHYLAVKEDITKRKKIETELLENEAKFRNVTETAPYAIITTDKYGKIISWNYAAQKMFGYTKKYAINKSILKMVPERFRRKYEQAINNEKHLAKLNLLGTTSELMGITSEGKEFPIDVSLSKWKVNNETFYTAHIKDITQRKLNEKALKESEEKYRAFFINDITADILVSPEGKLLDYNPAFLNLIGCTSKNSLKNINVADLYADASQRDRVLILLKEKRELQNYELKIKKRDGSFGIIVANIIGNFDENNNLISMQSYGFDITEKKQIENKIRRYQEYLEDIVKERTHELELSEEKFRALAENSDDTIMRFDRDYKHLYVNPAIVTQTGIPHHAFVGKTHKELGFPEDLCAIWENAIKKVFNTKNKNRVEFQLPNGRWIDWALLPEFNNRGEVNAVITFGRDITERKTTEETIAKALEREKELSKIKSLFLSSASHEFKTPLTTILSSVGLLETFRKRGNMEKYSQHLAKIESSVKYLSTMIEEILTLQKEESGKLSYNPVRTDLYKLAENVFNEISKNASKSHVCKLNYSIDKEKIFLLDKKLITLILSNLISNAIKYSPKGGKIEVNIGQKNKNIVMNIIDEGIGIASKDNSLIFTQFFRGVNYDDIPGTGLGLTIVKKSVDLHGGSVKFISRENKGATFTVTIPIIEKENV